jgi:hypothetical protein
MKMETNIQQDKVLTIIQNPTKKIYKNWNTGDTEVSINRLETW